MIVVDLSQEHSLEKARARLNDTYWRAKQARMALYSLPADVSPADRLSAQREADAANQLHAIAAADVARLQKPEQRRWAA